MISIKRFLEDHLNRPVPEHDVVEALTQMAALLLDAMATHAVRANEVDFTSLRRALNALAARLETPQSAMTLLGISSDAVEALETYCQSTTNYIREQNEERQSMLAMLADTVADLCGQTDASVDRLQAIEKQLERTSKLDDIRALRANLADSLADLREAASRQRSCSAATVERLQGQIAMARKRILEDPKRAPSHYADVDLVPEPEDGPAESPSSSYVAAFRLQRAEHIASRFGEEVKHEMLGMIAAQLKTVLGPTDRLLRWKGTSFVMFINSKVPIQGVRSRLLETVAATGQKYVEVGKKSALLSVGVDWIVFPQSDHPSLEAVFAEVEAFLSNNAQTPSPALRQG